MENFYDEIKRLCELNNIKIESLIAEASNNGCGYATFWGWKRRGIYPRFDMGYKICKILGVEPKHFFEEDDSNSYGSEYQELVKLYNNLSLDARSQVLNLMRTLQGK